MTDQKTKICLWYLEPSLKTRVQQAFSAGGLQVTYCECRNPEMLSACIKGAAPDLVLADYDESSQEREAIENELEQYYSELPLIYLVDGPGIREAYATIRPGFWDMVQKDQLFKLIPSVQSAHRYARMLIHSREAERALTESRDRYMSIFEGVNDGILLLDYDTRKVTDYNPRVLEMFNVGSGDMADLELSLYSMTEEGYTLEKARGYMTEAAKKGASVSFDWKNRSSSGRVFWTLNSISVVKIDQKPYILLVTRDVDDMRSSQLALQRSEERLNLALQATELGMWDWNLVTNEVYYSPIWLSMLGYGPDEMPQVLETWVDLQHPDERDRSWNLVQDVIKNREESFEIEFRLRHKSGVYMWVRGIGRAVGKDSKGNTIRLTGIHENIDRRKQEELVKKVVFDISNAVSSTQSLDELYALIRSCLGQVLDTTNCFLALYNEKADTLSLPFMDDEKDSFTEFPARKTLTSFVIRTGEAQLVDVNREKELIQSGEIEPVGAPCVSWLGVPLKYDEKTIGVFVVQSYSDEVIYTQSDARLLEFASDQIAMAIERRRQQDHIRNSQEKQRRVFESTPDPMVVVDKNAMILDFNSAFLEVFEVSPDDAQGEKVFRFIHRNHWRKSMREFEETWEKGNLKNLEYTIVRPDGREFEAEVSSGAMFDADGNRDSMVLNVKNISERKDAERKILEAKYKAEESDKLKTAFLSNMSHEIRTPMNAIVGFSDLLSDEALSSEERRDFIAQINQGADDLMRLIDDIIDIAKIEAGQVNIHIAECFIRDLFKELHLMFLQNIKRTGKEEVLLNIRWDWPVSDLAIYTDPFRLKQILINLLSNAVKFTEKGEIILGIEEDPEGIRFYVKDSGIGIREDKQKVIFDRFMQGHETKTKLYGGTGLGLAISKNLTEILGGEIGVESVSGEGATFWFTLPRNEVPLKYEAALRAPSSDVKSWEGKKILIAEDDHSNYYFLFEAIKDTGVQIFWSKDGEQTLETFREIPDLDLVLMDINMPLKNGYECTKIIKAERPDLPVIAQTAYAMSGEQEISREAGCDAYLSKPIKVKELLDTLANHL